MVHIGPRHKVSPFRGGIRRDPENPKFGPLKSEYLELELKSVRRELSMHSMGRQPPRESRIRKICIFALEQLSRADRRENLHDGTALSRIYVSFFTFGGDIFRGLQIGGQNGFEQLVFDVYSFGNLRHIQLSTHAWPSHS